MVRLRGVGIFLVIYRGLELFILNMSQSRLKRDSNQLINLQRFIHVKTGFKIRGFFVTSAA